MIWVVCAGTPGPVWDWARANRVRPCDVVCAAPGGPAVLSAIGHARGALLAVVRLPCWWGVDAEHREAVDRALETVQRRRLLWTA